MVEKVRDTERAPDPVPYNIFTPHQKALIVTIVSIAATFTGFASNIYLPSIPAIADDLSVSAELINLTVTTYMIFQGLSPTLWGSLADVQGRRITYICTFIIFFSACIGLAKTSHYYQLVILRCLQSTGSASTVAIGAGVIGDITAREERGGYMGYFQAGLLAPLAVGPILGGVFAETLGWRAIFWFLTIYSGAFLVVLILILPETLRSLVGNGSLPAKGVATSVLAYTQKRRLRSASESHAAGQESGTATERPPESDRCTSKKRRPDFVGPLRILFGLEITSAIMFLSIYYMMWQMTVTVMSTLFQRTYGLSEIHIGLTFIANGVGCILGTLLTGKFLDFDYRRMQSKYTGGPEEFSIERTRLRTIWLWSSLQCSSTLAFGWTLSRGVHISVPIICAFVIGWAATSIQGVIITLLVDVFPDRTASATAALNLARCLLGAGGTAVALPIVNAINVGWTFTLLTGIMLGSMVLIIVQMRCCPEKTRKRTEHQGEC
jgi:multidrug resistance protein